MTKIISLDYKKLKSILPPRPIDAHKGLFGRVVMIGGDYGMPGAVKIAGEGALRVGAGIVAVLTRPEHVCCVVSTRPELLCYGISNPIDNNIVDKLWMQASIVVVGPGLGRSDWSQQWMNLLLLKTKQPLPLLIDADGLNILAEIGPIYRENWILTPHPGEAARLLGISVTEIQSNRSLAASLLQKKYGGIIILKGSGTLIASEKKDLSICHAGNPGMASAGMGDLLSGIIAGLFAQGLTLLQSAELGVLLHAMAGDQVAAQFGNRVILATDLLSIIK